MIRFVGYDRFMKRTQEIDALDHGTVTDVFNGRGTVQVGVQSDADVVGYLAEEGARIVAEYDGGVVSGWISTELGPATEVGTIVYQVADDWGVLMDFPVPINPAEPISASALTSLAQTISTGPQTAGTVANRSGYYKWADTGSTESAVLRIIRDTVAWWKVPNIVIVPSKGRGQPPVLPDVRWSTLEEATSAMLAAAGLGLRVCQKPGDAFITVEVWEPEVHEQTITAGTGVIEPGGSYSRRRRPEATAVVVGGSGEEAARVFHLVRDAGLESVYGPIPVFKDATGNSPEWPDDVDDQFRVPMFLQVMNVPAALKAEALRYLNEAGQKALLEGKLNAGLNVALAVTDGFFVGSRVRDGITEEGFFLGDIIPVDLAGVPYRERIRKIVASLSGDGESIKPAFGVTEESASAQFYAEIARLQKTQLRISKAR